MGKKMPIRSKLIVSGNVQGVGYRALVKQTARRMNIKGEAINLKDGTVEILCEGEDKKAIEEFIVGIWQRFRGKLERKTAFDLDVENIEAFYEGSSNFEALKTYPMFRYKVEGRDFKESMDVAKYLLSSFRRDTMGSFDELGRKYHTISKTLSVLEDFVSKISLTLFVLAVSGVIFVILGIIGLYAFINKFGI